MARPYGDNVVIWYSAPIDAVSLVNFWLVYNERDLVQWFLSPRSSLYPRSRQHHIRHQAICHSFSIPQSIPPSTQQQQVLLCHVGMTSSVSYKEPINSSVIGRRIFSAVHFVYDCVTLFKRPMRCPATFKYDLLTSWLVRSQGYVSVDLLVLKKIVVLSLYTHGYGGTSRCILRLNKYCYQGVINEFPKRVWLKMAHLNLRRRVRFAYDKTKGPFTSREKMWTRGDRALSNRAVCYLKHLRRCYNNVVYNLSWPCIRRRDKKHNSSKLMEGGDGGGGVFCRAGSVVPQVM